MFIYRISSCSADTDVGDENGFGLFIRFTGGKLRSPWHGPATQKKIDINNRINNSVKVQFVEGVCVCMCVLGVAYSTMVGLWSY